MSYVTDELLPRVINALRERLKTHQNYADLWNKLGLCLWFSGEYDEGRKCFEKALKINPNYVDCAVNYAYILYQMGETETAISNLIRLYKRLERHNIAHTLGRFYALNGDLKNASFYLNKAAEKERPLLYRLDAYLLRLLSEPDNPKHRRAIRSLVASDPPYKRYISTHRLLGRNGSSRERILQTFTVSPYLHLVYVEIADLLASQGDLQTAHKLFAKAEAVLPDSPIAEYAMGQIDFARGEFNEAKKHLRRAIKYDPIFNQAYISLANVYASLGEFKQAEEYLRKAVQVEPSYPDLRYQLGNHLLQCGKYVEAKEQLEKALSIKPDYPFARYALATALFHLGEYNKVLGIYKKLSPKRLDLADIHAQKAACYLLLNKPAEALSECLFLLPKENRSTFSLYLAQAFFHIGNRNSAKKMLNRLLKEKPCPSLAHRARLLLKQIK